MCVHFLFTRLRRRGSARVKDKNICLLIAHPDDEAMFFGPCIRSLAQSGNRMFVLCLTRGDFYGLGRVRVDELKASCSKLVGNEGRLADVSAIDEPQKLADDPQAKWARPLARRIISSYIKDNSIDCVITFDK